MLLSNLNLLATAPGGVARLRELILTLAVQGKLVPQDTADEPASVLLQKIRAEKDRLIAEGKIKKDKPLAAIAEEEKPFELPDSWSWVALGEVIDIVRGITFPANQKTKEAAPGRIACLRTANVQQIIEWDDLLFVDRSFMGREEQLIQHHDIVMSMANSRELVGKVALIEHIPHAEATFGGFLGVLRPQKIDPRYAMAVLRNPYARSLLIDSSSQTTNIANVSLAKLRPLPFPLPPEAEQSRIVARVEELMRLCDALEAKGQLEATQHAQLVSTLLGTLTASATPDELADNWQRVAQHFDLLLDRPKAIDALEQTLLQLAVRGLLVPQDPTDEPASVLLQKICAEKDRLIAAGQIKRDKPLPPVTDEEKPFALPDSWKWVALGEVIDIVRGITFPANQKTKEAAPGRIACLRTANVQQSIEWDDLLFVDRSFMGREEQLIQHHDIVMSMANSRELVGKVALIEDIPHAEATFGGFLGVLRPRKIDPRFAMAVLRTPYARSLLIDSSSQTTNIANVSLAKLRPLPFPLPPEAEQSRIVTRVTQLRRLCFELRQRLAEREAVQARLAEALVQQVA